MAFFKFRSRGQKGDESSAGPTETIEGMRRRAKHRLIGAAILVLLGVIGFPLLFDSQPRPLPVDIAIDIPDKGKAKPIGIGAAGPAVKLEKPVEAADPAPPANTAANAHSNANANAKPPANVPASASLDSREEMVAASKSQPTPPSRPEKPAPTKPEPHPEPKPEPKPVAKVDESGARAKALL
ncbi:MAG: sporulation protein, partial [Rhodoferax sp.]|nr:sporulation protein [Rhodoferax sp.]